MGYRDRKSDATHMRTEIGISAKVIQTGQPRFIEDIEAAKDEVHPGMIKDGVKASVCLPLQYGDKTTGVMWGHYKKNIKFDKELINAWKLYASQAALAYGKAQDFLQREQTNVFLDAVIEASFDAVIAIDSKNKIFKFNSKAEEIYLYTEEELLGKSAEALYVSKKDARFISQRLATEKQITNFLITQKDKHGNTFPVLLSAKVIEDIWGEPFCQVGFAKDIREVELMEDRLHALMESSRAINNVAPEDVYLEIIRATLTSFPQAENVAIHTFDKSKGMLIPYNAPETGVQLERFQVGEGIAGWVFKNEQSLVLDKACDDPRYKKLEKGDHLSIACTYFQIENETMGVITVHNRHEEGVFRDEDLTLLSIFAGQIGTTLSNVEKYKRIEEFALSQEELRKFSIEINCQENPEGILELLADAGRMVLGVDSAVAHLLDGFSDRIFSYSSTSQAGEYVKPRPKGKLEKGLTQYILDKGKRIVINDTSRDARVNPKVRNKGIKSLVGFPLYTGGNETIGALFFDSTTRIDFKKKEKEFDYIASFISQSATALHRALLHARSERRLESLAKLSQAINEIFGILLNPDAQLRNQVILKNMAELLNAEGTSYFKVLSDAKHIVKEASWGHVDPDHYIGKHFPIHNKARGGLTGWIAHQRELYNEHGEELRNHWAVAGSKTDHLKSGKCAALLAVPLFEQGDEGDTFVGMLEAENKKDENGIIDDALGFTQEDIWILDIFCRIFDDWIRDFSGI